MPERGIYRGSSAKGYATPTNAPIYVNSSSGNSIRVIPAGSGSTEVELITSLQTGGVKIAAGTAALVSGVATVATGLSAITAFIAQITGATGFATGATECDDVYAKAITTGSVTVQGVFSLFTTGSRALSVSGTGNFQWIAVGT